MRNLKEIEREFFELTRELEEDREKNPGRYFIPNGLQERFLKRMREDFFIGLFIAANGVGKDALLSNIVSSICFGPSSGWFDIPIFRRWPYPKRIRIGTEANNIDERGSIDTEIKAWWPRGRYTRHKGGKLYYSEYTTATGFLIDKMSYAQEPKEWESATLGCACFSEPPSKEIFNATVSRMRRGGVILFFMTPLGGSAWVQDELVDSHDHDTFVVGGDIEENCRSHGVRGILEHRDIERMISRWDPEEIDARARGKFMHVSRVIFGKSFSRERHVIGNDILPPTGSRWFRVVDPAKGKPWAIGWGWVDKRGQIVFDHEYPEEDFTKMRESNLGLKDYDVIMKYGDGGRGIEWEVMDRHFGNTRDAGNRTLRGQLNNDYGYNFRDSYNCESEVETGIQTVKDYLRYDFLRPVDTLNFPRLLIKERCKNIIRGMERWQREPKTWKPEERSPFKDHVDLVRYMCQMKPQVYEGWRQPERRIGYVVGR